MIRSRKAIAAPWPLWPPVAVAFLLAVLPPAYLVIRARTARSSAWERLFDVGPELLWNSASLGAIVALLAAATALPAAWLVARTDMPGRRLWSVLLMLPLAAPSYVVALTVVRAFGPTGVLQAWLEPFGVERLPSLYGFRGAAYTLWAVTFPYAFLVIRAALRASDSSEDASRVLGAGPLRTLLRVVIPSLLPAITAASLLVFLYVLSDFGAVATLRYHTLTRAVFLDYTASFDRSAAAVTALGLAAAASVVVTAEVLVRWRWEPRARARRLAPARVQRLGRWRWPAMLYPAAIVLFTLVLPVAILIDWAMDARDPWQVLRDQRGPAWNSVRLASFGAAATVILALPVTILSSRYGSRLARATEHASFAAHALPGVVVALAGAFFALNVVLELYQTLWMLLIVYTVLFLPNALAALRGPLVRQPRHLEEAGATLGRGPLGVLWRVSLPLARPGVLSAAALVFLTVIKELPATLLLSPPGFRTLPGVIWDSSSEAFLGGASIPALLLLVLAGMVVALLTWRGEIDVAARE